MNFRRFIRRWPLLLLAVLLLTAVAYAAEQRVWGTPARFEGASIRKHMAIPPTSTRTGWSQDYYKSDGLPYTLQGSTEIGMARVGTDAIGYSAGAGGTVTQETSKATTVVLNELTGLITMDDAQLNAATIVSFTLTNSTIAATDTIILNHASGGTLGAYGLNAAAAAGSAVIYVRNNTGGNLTETPVLRFTVIKSAST